tara:strand:- start:193 stop:1023 length:831 start_codon:yes stop_codon:yes gene_type:complete
MQKLITTFIVLLSLIVFGVLCVSVYVTYCQINASSNNSDLINSLSLLPAIAISAGVLVAIFTFARERGKQISERERHVSEVILSQVKEGFETVINLLSDQNNNRVTWVRASRTLLKAVNLKSKITSGEYMVAYDLEEERVRNELYTILTIKDKKTGERNPLPPQFFYGIEEWKSSKSLDDAAIKSSSSTVAYSVTLDEVPPQPFLKPLSVHSVIAIFDFMEYPEDYKEPLIEVKDWEQNWAGSHGVDQGARRYVEHTKQKHAVGGKLYDRKSDKDS